MVNAGTYIFNGNALVGGDQVAANSNLPTTNVALIAPPLVNITLSNANIVVGNSTTLNGTAAVASPSIARSNNTNFPIPDGPAGCGTPGTNVNSTISITAPGVPANAIERVTVNITHTFTDDVRLTLIAPDGSSIVLINGCDVGGSNFTGTSFVASGAPSVLTGLGPLNGDWLPEDPFSSLTGTANGTWTLRVNDVFSIGTGTLLNWSIQIPNALNSASWTCPSCPSGFPVNFTTPPVVSVAYPNNPITYTAGIYTVTLTATDRQGCVNSRDTTFFFFDENRWLGVNDGPNNWNDPDNTYPPKINSAISTGSLQMQNGAEVQIASGGTLNLAANLSSTFGTTNGAGALVFNGPAGQTITGNHYASNVTVNKTTGTMAVNGSLNVSGTLTMANATSDITVGVGGNLVLTSNASGTGRIGVVPAGATITGEVTQQRWIPWPGPGVTGQWFFLGSPITNKDFRDFADNFTTYGPASAYGSQGAPIQVLGPQHSTILAYQESLSNDSTDEAQRDGWRAPSGLITNGQGYRVWIERSSVNASNTFDNKGFVKTGLATFPNLTRNVFGACSPAAYNCNLALTGWNLVANPYPSAIDWDAASGWTKPANMQNAAYRYFGGGSGGFGMAGYGAYISGLGWSGASPAPADPSIIPSSQGFFVRLTSGSSGVLSATEAVKVATPQGQFTRSNVVLSNVLKIALEKPIMQGDYAYNGVVRFMPEASDDLDPLYDYGNMGGSGFFFSFPVGGDQLMVNSLADLNEQKIVPMNTHFRGSNGAYLFNFSEMSSFPTGVEIYLKDKFANTLTDVIANPVYNFEVNASNSSIIDRFELIFNPSAVTGVKNLMGGAFFGVRPNPAAGNGKVTLAVSGVKDEVAQISIVDMVGKVVYVGKMNLKTEFLNEESVELGLPSGVYTVNFTSRSKSFKEKLIVR
jgi:subtilisin-like proprotein convertase family protein